MWTQAAFDEGIGKDVLMTLYDSMVESYAPKSAAERVAVQQEVMQLIALEFPGMRKYNRLCDYPNKDAMLAAEPGEVGVDVFNLGFRCGWRLNYLVFCPIKHINTLVFCLKNMI